MISEFLPTAPGSVKPWFPVKRFQANFDGFTGLYDFSDPAVAATNTRQVLMPVHSGSIYLLALQSFFANVPEGDWLEAMDIESLFPFFSLFFQNSKNGQVFEKPVRCVNYLDSAPQVAYYRTLSDDDNLMISFGGQVAQSAGMVGFDPIFTEVNFTIYEINHKKWVEDFNKGIHPILRAFPQLAAALPHTQGQG